MTRRILWPFPLAMAVVVSLGAARSPRPTADAVSLEEARIFFEFNQTDDDLGVHVFLDGEDWRELEIRSPSGRRIFAVRGQGGFREFGMTELFFEGAEPSLSEVSLEELLELFPEGEYVFEGRTVDGEEIGAEATFTHAVSNGPEVSTELGDNDFVQIRWTPVPGSPPGFPKRDVVIVGFQVIVGSFQVTLPASARSVTLPPEFVASLEPGEHDFEVLAIEEGGNQTITASSFEL